MSTGVPTALARSVCCRLAVLRCAPKPCAFPLNQSHSVPSFPIHRCWSAKHLAAARNRLSGLDLETHVNFSERWYRECKLLGAVGVFETGHWIGEQEMERKSILRCVACALQCQGLPDFVVRSIAALGGHGSDVPPCLRESTDNALETFHVNSAPRRRQPGV